MLWTEFFDLPPTETEFMFMQRKADLKKYNKNEMNDHQKFINES